MRSMRGVRASPSTSSAGDSISSKSSTTAWELPPKICRWRSRVMRQASCAPRQSSSRLATLGFRGEGLASIAAVSQTRDCSRAKAMRRSARASRQRASESVPSSRRRRRSARGFAFAALFENVFRCGASTFAVAKHRVQSHLVVALELRAGLPATRPSRCDTTGSDVWVMPASAEPRERLAMVFGRQAAKTLLPLDADSARTLDGGLRGFVSAPGHDRPDRRMQLLFVNGRLVRSALLAGAWTSGYSDLHDDRTPSVRRALSRPCRPITSIPTCIRPRATCACATATKSSTRCGARSARRLRKHAQRAIRGADGERRQRRLRERRARRERESRLFDAAPAASAERRQRACASRAAPPYVHPLQRRRGSAAGRPARRARTIAYEAIVAAAAERVERATAGAADRRAGSGAQRRARSRARSCCAKAASRSRLSASARYRIVATPAGIRRARSILRGSSTI